jgi:hypothetical protein
MSLVSSSTTACATTLDAKAARAAEVVGPGVVELSMSWSRRSMRRETVASAGMSSVLKSLKALNTGSSFVIVVLSLNYGLVAARCRSGKTPGGGSAL